MSGWREPWKPLPMVYAPPAWAKNRPTGAQRPPATPGVASHPMPHCGSVLSETELRVNAAGNTAPGAGLRDAPSRSEDTRASELPPSVSGPLRAPAAAYTALEALYRDLDAEIAELAPRCDARGLCCDFDIVDHRLYASKLEVDYVKDHDPDRRYTRDSGNCCPFLENGRCGARGIRMLGCRTYFCQPGWEPFGAELYERYYAAIQRIAVEHGLEWAYAPALAQFRDGT
jgi:hypothetical protein